MFGRPEAPHPAPPRTAAAARQFPIAPLDLRGAGSVAMPMRVPGGTSPRPEGGGVKLRYLKTGNLRLA